jgi:hypothetical protein
VVKKRTVALLFRCASLALVLAGILSNFLRIGADETVNFSSFSLFMYYTIQSNLLALVLFGMLTVRTVRDLRKRGLEGHCGYFPRFSMIVAIDLLLTLVGFWVLLAPQAFAMDGAYYMASFPNLMAHLVTPLLCLADYFLFAQPGHLKYGDVYKVLIYPLSYVAFVTVAGVCGYTYRQPAVDGGIMHYPYFFLDWERLGARVILFCGALILFFLLLSHCLYWLDRKRCRAAEQTKEP